MPKPQPRLPQAGSAEVAAAEVPASLAPAPDNGRPFGEQPTTPPAGPRPVVERRGKQLGMRIPEVIYDRLEHCSRETGFTKSALVAVALDEKLKALGY